MKVVQINAVYGVASTGRTTKEMHCYLLDKGIDAFVFSATLSEDNHVIALGSRLERKIEALNARITGLQGYGNRKTTQKMIAKLEEINPDIIVLRNLHSNMINYAMLFDYLAKKHISTVLILHDCFWFTGKCVHYTKNRCDKWKTGCNSCGYYKNQGIPSWFFDRTEKMWTDKKLWFDKICDLTVVGVSEWIKDEAAKAKLFENAKRIVRIYNWIDLNVFYPYSSEKSLECKLQYGVDNKMVIMAIASEWNNLYDKGLDKIIELASAFDDTYQIILVGAMPEGIKKILPEQFFHIERTNSVQQLVDYYNMADVVLQASQEESFGKIVAEALACGTPVITNGTTANPELVSEKCGLVVDYDRVDLIKDFLLKLKKKDKNEIIDACRERAKQLFDKENLLADYLRLFDEVTK